MIPDFGLGSAQGDSENKTATEVNYIRAISSVGVDLKGRIFRKGLGKLYQIVWALIVQKKTEEVVYFTSGDQKILPAQALVDAYRITPAGSADMWNKNQKIQRAMGRFQMFNQDP